MAIGSPARPIAIARKLRAEGDFLSARAVLEGLDLDSDDMAALYYIMVLDELDDQKAKQEAVVRFIGSLTSVRSDAVLTMLLRQSERACLPPAMIEKVLNAAAKRCSSQVNVELVHHAVSRRRAFNVRYGNTARRVRLISIGRTCLPWTIPNRWGFRTAEQFVADFNPFCLAQHTGAAVVAALSTDFEGYLDPHTIELSKDGAGNDMPIRMDGSAKWNHNLGPYWLEPGYTRLRENLGIKIDNFRRSCRAEGPLAFFYSSDQFPGDDLLSSLKSSIRTATGRNDCRLILADQNFSLPASGPTRIDATTTMFHRPFPSSDYVWFNMQMVDSPIGLNFEEDYVTTLLSCLQNIP